MDTKLYNGGFATGHTGLPIAIDGMEELAQQAYIRLVVRRGSFAPDQELGSDLYKLPRGAPQVLNPMAAAYIEEALCTMPTVRTKDVNCLYNSTDDSVHINVTLEIGGKNQTMEVTV